MHVDADLTIDNWSIKLVVLLNLALLQGASDSELLLTLCTLQITILLLMLYKDIY